MKIILLGAPGSGKGTLAKKISRDFNIPQIYSVQSSEKIILLQTRLKRL